jgi:putative flavoprotein involved in K+ transport
MAVAVETVIIGAGQAGLSTSYYLKQMGHEHVVLEKADRPASAWRSERWDSFTFVTPNWTFSLPGGEYDGPEPDGFMSRAELVARFDRYVDQFDLPVVGGSCVTSVMPEEGGGFMVSTSAGDYRTGSVVVATGWFQQGKLPPFAASLPADIVQIHTSAYRSPGALPPGAVLVVGAGQSGAQIAEELYLSGRRVFLATGTAPHAPRRYRGKDIFRWFIDSGVADRTFEQLSFHGHPFVAPMISGKDGGHALNLHRFYRDGVILLGHARGYSAGRILFAPDLHENLTKADMGQKILLQNIDDYIARSRIDAPPSDIESSADAYLSPEIASLDLSAEGIRSIIWGCGYTFSPSIFPFSVLDRNGMPDAPNGISIAYPGLYFAGFPFLPALKTGFFAGVAHSTARIAGEIWGNARGSKIL